MLSKISIRQKIILALGSVLLLLVSLSVYNYFKIQTSNIQVKELLDLEVKIEKDMTAWKTAIEKNNIRTRVISLIEDATLESSLREDMKDTSQEVDRLQQLLEKNIYVNSSKKAFAEVLEARKIYSESRASFLNDRQAGKISNLEKEFNDKVQIHLDLYMSKVNALLKLETDSTKISQSRIINDLNSFQHSLIVTSGLAILIGIIMCIVVTNSIVKPIEKAIDFSNHIANGDLTQQLENNSKDEVGTLVRTLQQMNTNLQTIVRDVRDNSGELFSSSTEISSGNLDLSQRTESVAASLEEAAASIEEFSQTLSQTSEHSTFANSMTNQAYENAQKVGKDINNFTLTMTEISNSSKQIGNIISVIESIAFQTNLLALNAAVEAARAGEHGRGFSVVASEVRTLSKRTSEAAKEIKSLINDSQNKVNEGTKAVTVSNQSVDSLIHNIKAINEIVSEINNSTKEQSLGIKQINEVIAHIDQSTQQNAALVEESSAATESMKQKTNHLNNLVSQFKV